MEHHKGCFWFGLLVLLALLAFPTGCASQSPTSPTRVLRTSEIEIPTYRVLRISEDLYGLRTFTVVNTSDQEIRHIHIQVGDKTSNWLVRLPAGSSAFIFIPDRMYEDGKQADWILRYQEGSYTKRIEIVWTR